LAKLPPPVLEAFFARVPDETRRERVRALVERGLDAPGVGPALRLYHRTIGSMSKALSSGDWLVGQGCTLADITMLPYVLRLVHLGLDWYWEEWPAVGEWLARMQSRPGYESVEERLDPNYLQIMPLVAASERARLHGFLAGTTN